MQGQLWNPRVPFFVLSIPAGLRDEDMLGTILIGHLAGWNISSIAQYLDSRHSKNPPQAGYFFLPARDFRRTQSVVHHLSCGLILHSSLATYLPRNLMESYAVPRNAFVPPTEFHEIISFLRATGIVMGTCAGAVRVIQTILRLLSCRWCRVPGNALVLPAQLHKIIPFLLAAGIDF